MLQTFPFGTNVHETIAVRFAEQELENTSNAGMTLMYPLIFGTELPTKSVLGNAIVDENYCFPIFPFEPIGIRFNSHLPKFGVHR